MRAPLLLLLVTSAVASAEEPPSWPCSVGGVSGVIVHTPNVDLDCEDRLESCHHTVVTTVANCTPRPIELDRLSFPEAQTQSTLSVKPDTKLAPGHAYVFRREMYREGSYRVIAEGPRGVLGTAQFEITRSLRTAAIAACRRCNGTWGPKGILGHEMCDCATTDAGRVCTDGGDCEGECLFDHYEEVTRADPKTHTLATGRPVGTCSARSLGFGCLSVIERGASREPPVTLPRHPGLRCAD